MWREAATLRRGRGPWSPHGALGGAKRWLRGTDDLCPRDGIKLGLLILLYAIEPIIDQRYAKIHLLNCTYCVPRSIQYRETGTWIILND